MCWCGFSAPCKNLVFHRCRPKGLGDALASTLSLVGITERLVSGLLGGPCKCAQRKEKLNSLGRKIGIGVPGTPVRGNN